MTTKVDIWNMALSYAKHGKRIKSDTENTTERIVCATHWDQALTATLIAHPWSFAEETASLVKMPLEAHPKYEFVYQYPVRCIEDGAREIINSYGKQTVKFKVTNIGGQRRIVTDQDGATLVYTIKVTDPNLYGAIFIDAAAYNLAYRISSELGKKASVAREALQMFEEIALPRAQTIDAAEGDDQEEISVPWHEVPR